MPTYRTALGKQIDMAALAAKHEKVRAVGNMKVNARGDAIDSYGQVVIPANEKVSRSYAKTVGNKSAQPVKQKNTNTMPPLPSSQTLEEDHTALSVEEQELENNLKEDLEVERIKQEELKKQELSKDD